MSQGKKTAQLSGFSQNAIRLKAAMAISAINYPNLGLRKRQIPGTQMKYYMQIKKTIWADMVSNVEIRGNFNRRETIVNKINTSLDTLVECNIDCIE